MNISTKAFKNGTDHPLHQIWYLMIYRCTNDKYHKYHRYGGRGILVCPKWFNFDDFIIDMYPSYVEGYTLDRINNDGNYEPSNCQWIPREVNSKKDMSKGINKYTLDGVFIEYFEAMSDANISLGLKSNHGGLSRALAQNKPFKCFRWARKDNQECLIKEEMSGKLINTNVAIVQLNKNTLEVIKIWKNAKEIIDVLGVNGGSLSRVCSGKLNSTKGFKWKYQKEI